MLLVGTCLLVGWGETFAQDDGGVEVILRGLNDERKILEAR